MRRLHVALVVSVFVVLAQGSASAQSQNPEGLDTERFKPAIDSQGMFLTEGGQGEEGGELNLGFYLHYSRNPLVIKRNGEVYKSLVSDRLGMNLMVSMGITRWLTVGINVPATLVQQGQVIDNQFQSLGLASAALGDIVVAPKFTALREKSQGVSLALVLPVSMPSGDEASFLGSKSVTVAPTLALSRHFLRERLYFALNLGFWVRQGSTYQNLNTQNEMFYRLGAGVQFVDRWWILGEAVGASKLDNLFQNKPEESSLEWLLGMRWHGPKDLWFSWGGAMGTLPGWGTPNFRAFVSMIWAPRTHDTDADGIEDAQDRCPSEPGPVANNGCPWGDADADGILDNEDQCQNDPGPAENHGCPYKDSDGDGLKDNEDRCPNEPGPKENQGCPWGDADKDGLNDREDRCPNEPGPKENQGCPWGDADKDGVNDHEDRCPKEPGPKENQGCPWGDRDKDGVKDNVDKCPDEAGPKENKGCPYPDADKDGVLDKDDKCPNEPGLPENKGCPPKKVLVIIKKEKIEILQKVHFATGKATIMPDSFQLLDQVYLVLKTHEEIKKIRIEGHTDSQGAAAMNLKLSQDRAEAVKKYMSKKGIAAERMEAAGYGMTKPIASNNTEKGREANRRVEFMITPDDTSIPVVPLQ